MRFRILGIEAKDAGKQISDQDWSDYHMVWQKIYCADPTKMRFRVLKCVYKMIHANRAGDIRSCPEWNDLREACPSIEVEDIQMLDVWQCVRMSSTDLVYLKLLVSS